MSVSEAPACALAVEGCRSPEQGCVANEYFLAEAEASA